MKQIASKIYSKHASGILALEPRTFLIDLINVETIYMYAHGCNIYMYAALFSAPICESYEFNQKNC